MFRIIKKTIDAYRAFSSSQFNDERQNELIFDPVLNREMQKFFDVDYFKLKYDHLIQSLSTGKILKPEDYHAFYSMHVRKYHLDPNNWFSEKDYLQHNPDVAIVVDSGGLKSGFHHWLKYGQFEQGRKLGAPRKALQVQKGKENSEIDLIKNLFDVDYYVFKILKADIGSVSLDAAVFHFINNGYLKGVVPVSILDFDEDFYTSYYKDVMDLINNKSIPSGYYHYIHAGLFEKRHKVYDPGALLRDKLGKGANPRGLDLTGQLEKKLMPLSFYLTDERAACVNVFIPSIDPTLMFGGYIAFLHFLARLAQRGHRLRFVIFEDKQSNKAWFLRGIAANKIWYQSFADQEYVNCTEKSLHLGFNYNDICIAYSCWTMLDAYSISKHLRVCKPIFFIQEYEPIFNEYDSINFIAASAYLKPHVAIFNSVELTSYFRDNGLGVFSKGASNEYITFNHAITSISRGRRRFKQGSVRRVLVYARPELHAARNLFEVCIIALKNAVRSGLFDKDWEFYGIGSFISNKTIMLGNDHEITLVSRKPIDEYEKFLEGFDIGLSLIWGPHPGVVHYEMAKSGLITVTNIFSNRSAEYLSSIHANLVPCEASIEGVVKGIEEAIHRLEDDHTLDDNQSKIGSSSWSDTFNDEFYVKLQTLIVSE